MLFTGSRCEWDPVFTRSVEVGLYSLWTCSILLPSFRRIICFSFMLSWETLPDVCSFVYCEKEILEACFTFYIKYLLSCSLKGEKGIMQWRKLQAVIAKLLEVCNPTTRSFWSLWKPFCQHLFNSTFLQYQYHGLFYAWVHAIILRMNTLQNGRRSVFHW